VNAFFFFDLANGSYWSSAQGEIGVFPSRFFHDSYSSIVLRAALTNPHIVRGPTSCYVLRKSSDSTRIDSILKPLSHINYLLYASPLRIRMISASGRLSSS
jgi:hypothetical protein